MATRRNETVNEEERKTTELPASLHTKFKLEAVKRGVTLIEATEQAVQLWIKTEPTVSRKNHAVS